MIRFMKAHIVALAFLALIAAIICFAYLPMRRAWPEVFPSSLRGLFIMASMPWSWATLTPLDAFLWKQSPEINRIVPELLIAIGFGINVAIAAALAWFRVTQNAPTANSHDA